MLFVGFQPLYIDLGSEDRFQIVHCVTHPILIMFALCQIVARALYILITMLRWRNVYGREDT